MDKEEKKTMVTDERLIVENGGPNETNMDAFWAIVNDRYDEYMEEQKNDTRYQ